MEDENAFHSCYIPNSECACKRMHVSMCLLSASLSHAGHALTHSFVLLFLRSREIWACASIKMSTQPRASEC